MGIRKLAGLLMVVALVAVLLIPGCAPEGEGEVTPPPAEEHEEMTLIMAMYYGPMYEPLWSYGINVLPEYINEHGKGILQIDLYHSGTLLDAKNIMPGLMAGTADLIAHTDSYLTGSFPIYGIRMLPGVFPEFNEAAFKACDYGSPLHNFMNEQLAKKNIFEFGAGGPIPEYLFVTNRAVRTPSDMKGLKIRTAGAVESRWAAACGGASATIPSAEAYLALQRGTVDGILCYVGTPDGRALDEVLHYAMRPGFASYGLTWIAPLDRWNSWPKDVQDLLIEAGHVASRGLWEGYTENGFTYWSLYEDEGITIVDITPEDYNAFTELYGPIYDWWTEQVGADVANEALRLAGVK